MSAFVEMQHSAFAEVDNGFRTVKHHAFVGTGFFDAITTICGQASTLALKGSTEEEQFTKH